MTNDPTCPECLADNHKDCTGQAYDEGSGGYVYCDCRCS